MKVGTGRNLDLSREYHKTLFGPLFHSWWNCPLTDSQILFGDRSWDPIINNIAIVVKSIIFKNKHRNKIPTLNQVI